MAPLRPPGVLDGTRPRGIGPGRCDASTPELILKGEDAKGQHEKKVARQGFVELFGPSMPVQVLEACPETEALPLPGASKGVLEWISKSVERGEPQALPGGIRNGILQLGHLSGSSRLTGLAMTGVPVGSLAGLLAGPAAASVVTSMGENFWSIQKQSESRSLWKNTEAVRAMREAILSLPDLEAVAPLAGFLARQLGSDFTDALVARHPEDPVARALVEGALRSEVAAADLPERRQKRNAHLVETIRDGASSGAVFGLLGAGADASCVVHCEEVSGHTSTVRSTTPLFEAVLKGRLDVVERLLVLGADPESACSTSRKIDGPDRGAHEYARETPLSAAKRLARPDIVEALEAAPARRRGLDSAPRCHRPRVERPRSDASRRHRGRAVSPDGE